MLHHHSSSLSDLQLVQLVHPFHVVMAAHALIVVIHLSVSVRHPGLVRLVRFMVQLQQQRQLLQQLVRSLLVAKIYASAIFICSFFQNVH